VLRHKVYCIMPNAELSKLRCDYCSQAGALLRCGRCKAVAYCNYKCQRAGWRQHKAVCGKKEERQPAKPVDAIPLARIAQDSKAAGYVTVGLGESPGEARQGIQCIHPVGHGTDTLNYKKWDNLEDSDDDSAKSPAAQTVKAPAAAARPMVASTGDGKKIKLAESMVGVVEMEIDRLSKEIARISGSGSLLNARLTGGIERDLRHCEKTLDDDVMPVLTETPAAFFLHGVVHFLLRSASRDEQELMHHHTLARDSLLQCYKSRVLPVQYQLNAADLLGSLLQVDGDFEKACLIVEHASETSSSYERYLLMARCRVALARTCPEDSDRLRALRIARTHFEHAVGANPKVERTYAELDIVLEDLGERAAQLALVDRCIMEGVWWERRLQRPQHYQRGISTKPFWENSSFPFCQQLEKSFNIIRVELEGLMGTASSWQAVGCRCGPHDAALARSGLWNELVLLGGPPGSREVAETLCPNTLAVVEACADVAEFCRTGGGEVLFSRISPGCQINPHCGLTNLRLTCHLALVIPEGCSLQVGGELPRSWQEGQCLVFDDSFEHSAVNTSQNDRVVLLSHFWHPSVQVSDRPSLAAAFQG